MEPLKILLTIVGAAVVIALAATLAKVLGPWLRAREKDVPITIGQLLGMLLRRTDPGTVVQAYTDLAHAGFSDIGVDTIEAHSLAGGNVAWVVEAVVAAREARVDVDFRRAAAIDLAGQDPVAAVEQLKNTGEYRLPGEPTPEEAAANRAKREAERRRGQSDQGM